MSNRKIVFIRIKFHVSNRFPWDINQFLSLTKHLIEFRGSKNYILLDADHIIFERLDVLNVSRLTKTRV